jgi:hypothetical protein
VRWPVHGGAGSARRAAQRHCFTVHAPSSCRWR